MQNSQKDAASYSRRDRINSTSGVSMVNENLPIRLSVLDKGWAQIEELMGGDALSSRRAVCYQSVLPRPSR
jgi:hypothetical protein